jgi:NADPH:quinone reductase-like Zn-dependent oxidoreductase
MKVWELQDFGIENLKQVEKEIPQPGVNQLLVKVGAVSLNYRDKAIVEKVYLPEIMKLPIVPVSDLAGEVVSIGRGVTRFRAGDRVTSQLYSTWVEGKKHDLNTALSGLGGPIDGGLGEYILLDEQAAVPTPSSLTDEEAATLPIAALTAWNALTIHGNLQAGETVLVQGTGGVSLFALKLAKALGAKVIVTSSSDEKLEKAKLLGADYVINYKQFPEWHEEVLKITDGKGVDHIIEVVGGSNVETSLKATAVGGQIHVIGFLDGVSTSLDLLTLLFKGVRINGILVGNRNAFEEMNTVIEKHKIKPVIDHVYSLDQALDAYKHIERGAFGKIVIKIS